MGDNRAALGFCVTGAWVQSGDRPWVKESSHQWEVTQTGHYNPNVVKCPEISGRGALKGPLDSTLLSVFIQHNFILVSAFSNNGAEASIPAREVFMDQHPLQLFAFLIKALIST